MLTDAVAKGVIGGLKITNKEWKQEFEDLSNRETQILAGQIRESVRIII